MDAVQILTVADLLRLSRPLSGAASLRLFSSSPPPPSKRPKLDQPLSGVRLPCSDQGGDARTFSPIGRPVLLVGTVDLFPEDWELSAGCRNHCLSFSDDAAASSSSSCPSLRLCCSILDFDVRIVGRKINVLAWNFVPLMNSSRGGVLEVIRWSLLELNSASNQDVSLSIRPVKLSQEDNSNARAFGILKAVSPIFNVPHSKKVNKSVNDCLGVGSNAVASVGFLAEMLVCRCFQCIHGSCTSDICGQNCHSFTESKFVYFIKPASIWRSVLFQLTGKTIIVSGLKKKLLFLKSDESYSTFVSTMKTMVSLCQLAVNSPGIATKSSKDGAEFYSGVVTAVYMNGMAVELDEKVWLLMTNLDIAPPHSLRVGAIVSVTNFHLVHPTFKWTRILLLGTCPRTCISINSFSLSETRCHPTAQTNSLLGKFIESLSFSARFWTLLLISCFKMKFTSIFSYKEILGSTNKKGLAQFYAASYLPSSAVQSQHGLFMEFCKHELCGCKTESGLNSLKLVIPICDLISRGEAILCSMISGIEKDAQLIRRNHYSRSLICQGLSYSRIISRTVSSDELGFILMGKLMISPHARRLQLVDATGSIDVFIQDVVLGISLQHVYEVRNYKIVLEGLPSQLDNFQNHLGVQSSCRAIFQQHIPRRTLKKFAIYGHFLMRDLICIDFPSVDGTIRNESQDKVTDGKFHLLLITHKFRAKDAFNDSQNMQSCFKLFAEAVVLPYNLLSRERCQCHSSGETSMSKIGSKSFCISHLKDSRCHVQPEFILMSNFNPYVDESFKGPDDALGNASEEIISKQTHSRILLEFIPDSFNKYQLLSIGSYYALRCSCSLDCSSRNCEQLMQGKALIDTQTTLLSFSFPGKKMHNGGSSENQDSSSSSEIRQASAAFFCLDGLIQLVHLDQGLSDLLLHLPNEAIRPLRGESVLPELGLGLTPADEIISVSSCIQLMMLEFVKPSGNTDLPVSKLPQGYQVSIKGIVEDIHTYGSKFKSYCVASHDNMRIHKICVHVAEHNHMVHIRGSLRTDSCPVGLGPGANATFFRVLMTRNSSRCRELLLTPMSFVAINSITEPTVICDKESVLNDLENHLCERSSGVPIGSISQIAWHIDDKLIQYRCRVVNVLTLVLEKYIHGSQELRSGKSLVLPKVNIPLAAFVIDDGSSLCCCWASGNQAESFLRLHKVIHENSSVQKKHKAGSKKLQHTASFRLRKMLKKHQNITIQNHGGKADSSFMDLTFSFSSDKIFSAAEEKLLNLIVLHACHGPLIRVGGYSMDSNALNFIKLKFPESSRAIDSMKHLWIKEVDLIDALREARTMLDALGIK